MTALLDGNGAGLVRARAMAAAVQESLERLYQLERVADVGPFMIPAENRRETLLVRQTEDGALEMALHVPMLAGDPIHIDNDELDPLCQLIEGVSHFVYLSHRADVGRETTALEMEMQAEVDKWVVLGAAMRPFDARSSQRLRERLYERVSYLHPESTELGERYRIANAAAARFVRGLEQRFLARHRYGEMRGALREFFRHGQEEKIRLGRAA